MNIKIKEQPKADGTITIGSKTPSSLVTDGSIAGTSFKRAERRVKHRMIISVEGAEKSGKTHFALTAPGAIGLQDIDIGTEGVIDSFVDDLKACSCGHAHPREVHVAEYALDFPFEQKAAEQMWRQMSNDYRYLLGSEVRTGIIDNASEAWDLLRVAKFGRLTQIMPHLYTTVNSEFRGLLRLAYKSDINLILLHKVKKQYINDEFTGKFERTGFNDVGYLVQVVVETYKEGGKFFLKIKDCRQNAKVEGQIIEDPTFTKLGMLVFPGTVEEDWQ